MRQREPPLTLRPAGAFSRGKRSATRMVEPSPASSGRRLADQQMPWRDSAPARRSSRQPSYLQNRLAGVRPFQR
jgi:hypothetical protein